MIRASARVLPFSDGIFQTIVTSPPYFGKMVNGEDPEEFGHGSLDQYIADIAEFSFEMWRVLRNDGIFWLNIGDTFSNSGGAGGDYNPGGSRHGLIKFRQGHTGLRGSQQIMVPARVALMLQLNGWVVRKWITWDKGSVTPEDKRHVRRPLNASEVILMLTKHSELKQIKFNSAPLGEDWELGDVWRFPPARNRKRGHPTPFPAELPRRCILLSTDPGDIVCDPMVGSGTTSNVATDLGRIGVGTDLYAGR